MTREPVCVDTAASVRDMARVFAEFEISGAPVIDQAGKVVGVVSRADLLRRYGEGTLNIPPAYLFEMLREQADDEDSLAEFETEQVISVSDFMSEPPVVVDPDTPLREVARKLIERRVHRVIVVDEDAFPLGIITSLDLVRVLAEKS